MAEAQRMKTRLHEKWFKSLEQAGETSGVVELETQTVLQKKSGFDMILCQNDGMMVIS